METKNTTDPVEGQAKNEAWIIHPIQNLFLLDVLRDRDSRPAIFWALSTLMLGTIFYHWVEGWSYLNSLYFCVVSLGTVGYGDFTPKTAYGKMFTIIYLINGIVILLALFDRIRIVRSQHLEKLAARRRESQSV